MPLLELRVDHQGLPRRPRPRRRLLRPRGGRGPRALRRERRGQEHAHQDRSAAYYPSGTYGGEILLDGAARALPQPEGRRGARHRPHRPGAGPGARALGGREPRARPRAGARRPHPTGTRCARDAETRPGAASGSTSIPSAPVKELGIGQQQMVEIAKALAKNARILVLDEPTAALTEADAQRLLRLLARAARARRVVHLHQPPPGGGLPDRRPHHRAARRPVGRRPTARAS